MSSAASAGSSTTSLATRSPARASLAWARSTPISARVSGLPAARRSPSADIVGKRFDPAVEQAAVLEFLHQALLMAEILEAASLGERDRERLQGVVAQHQRRDVVGHGGEQAVPPRQIELAGAHGAAEGDLDVDLDVGGVDPGGVVDRVGIAASAGEAELDPRPRRHAEIGALADDARAELRRRDPDGIVGAVADLAVALFAAAHEGADAAEEEEVGPHL